MISESKIMAAKAFQFPALVSLEPKRRFKASGRPSLEPNDVLVPIASPAPRHRGLRKSGHLSLRWATPQSGITLAEPKIESSAA